jgi:hypothetical protein
MIINDIYQDQIMINHTPRTWSTRCFNQLISDLKKVGWQVLSKNTINLTLQHEKSKRLLIAHVMHNLPPDLDPQTIVVTDVVAKDYVNKILEMSPEVFGEFYHDFEYLDIMPTTKFNCFINRGCPFRQSWIYQFQRHRLLNQGHVSYWCEDRFNKTHPTVFFETLFQKNNQIFQKEHQELMDQIPYKNFDLPLEHAILDSKLTVIIETFFDNNKNVCYSEKTWRSLQLPRPWVLFGVAHAVDHLRQWGFDVLDDYVDHSYDLKTDAIERQLMILDQVENGIQLNLSNLKDLEQRAQHNKMLLLDYKQRWPKKYKSIIEDLVNINNNESFTLRT